MVFYIPSNMCLVFFQDPDAKFTPERLKQVLAENGVTVTGDQQPFALRSGNGPTLHASINRGEIVAILAVRLMGRRRKHRMFAAGCDACIEITFENLDEVLDEINTLIVVQGTLQEATGGLLYRSWNQTFSGPGD